MDNKCVSVPEEFAGDRLDKILAKMFPEFSRSRLKCWIDDNLVLVNGQTMRPRDILVGGESIEILKVEPLLSEPSWQAESMELDIIYQDADIIVLNKPCNLVVHPAAGNWQGTLVNGLIHFDSNLTELPRVGVVHRLDKDTTGLMVVARNLKAHASLVRQLQKRKVKREYQAVVFGVLTGGGKIDAPIGRHPKNRTKMAVVGNGKPAITHYRVLERFRAHTLVRVILKTGRTHQIRVHMAHNKMPIVGDKVYAGRARQIKNSTFQFSKTLSEFPRQALHACKLGLSHPASGKEFAWEIDLPEDMQNLLSILKQDLNQD